MSLFKAQPGGSWGNSGSTNALDRSSSMPVNSERCDIDQLYLSTGGGARWSSWLSSRAAGLRARKKVRWWWNSLLGGSREGCQTLALQSWQLR